MHKHDWKLHWIEGCAVFNSRLKSKFGIITSVEDNTITIKRKSGESIHFNGKTIPWNNPTSYRLMHEECSFIYVKDKSV